MRLVISGASGFIGAAVTRLAVAAGHDVAVVARDGSALARLNGARVTEIRCALDRPGEYADCLAAFAPETAIHCAWGGIAGAARDIQMHHARFRIDAADEGVFPQAMQAARHQIIHQIVIAGDRFEDIEDKAGFFFRIYMAETEPFGFGVGAFAGHGLRSFGLCGFAFGRGFFLGGRHGDPFSDFGHYRLRFV